LEDKAKLREIETKKKRVQISEVKEV